MTDSLYLQKRNRVDLDDFRMLTTALGRARAEEVPTYCPTLFGEVLALWKQAQNEADSTGSASQGHKHLEEAMEKLALASKLAASSRDKLADLVRLRADSQRDVSERYHAPEILIEAERYYWLAIREAENGKLDAAGRHAAAARKLYRDATIQSLERGPIAHLQNQVIEAEQTVPQGRLQDAARELADLRDTLDQTRQGDLSVSALRTRIAISRGAIGSLLTLVTDLSWNGEVSPFDTPRLPEVGGTEPPDPPVTMRISGRTENSLTVWWLNQPHSGSVNKLIRQTEDGAFEVVAEFGHLSGWTSYTDTGLQPDTRYCYLVRTENDYARRTTLVDNAACGYTRDGNDLKVWRVQLTIRTADVSDADTDDDVQVRLNSPLTRIAPSGNATWLDYGLRLLPLWSDDFGRGSEFTYDLNLSNISELSDITMLTIAKEGTDAIGIAEISLKINGKEVFERFFGETASTCLWIDKAEGYSPSYGIWHSELRAHPGWNAYIASPAPAPLEISNEEMVSRLEGMIGHAIHGTRAYWDIDHFYAPAWVEATRLDDETLQVDVDLGMPVFADNAELDLNFQLEFKTDCNPQAGTTTLRVATKNFNSNVDVGILDDLLTFGIIEFFEDDIAKGILNAFQPIVQRIVLDTGGLCPRVKIDDYGNVYFVLA